MTMHNRARFLALLVPALLLGGAYGSQYLGGLFPCEMCWWQRYLHFAALPMALIAFAVGDAPRQRLFVALAAFAIIGSAIIGGYHAGVEYHWWPGPPCSSTISAGGDILKSIMKAPLIRCDQPQWTFAGVSLAGFNCLISGSGALAVFAMLAKART